MTKKPRKLRQGRSARATEERVVHSIDHPVRLDALSILIERVASPTEIHRLLRVPLGTASFHIKELLEDDVIELVKVEQRRGALEHYYRAKKRPEISDRKWRTMPKASRREMAALLLRAIVAEGLSSLRRGKMDADDDLHLAWSVVRLDAEGRDEVTELQAETLGRLEAIKERNEARLSRGGEVHSVRVVATMGFERGRSGDQPLGDALGPGKLAR